MAEKKLRGLLDRAQATIGGLLGDFPQGFNAGAVAGVAGYPGDIAYMLDTAGRAITGQDTQPAAQDFPGTTDYIAAKAGYPIPGSFSGQLGAAVGGMLTPGPGDLAKFAPVLSAIPFWHGSPHKYDAVDLSKIGTGEGAQAYGHGYYGADAKAVAEQYAQFNRAELANGNVIDPGPFDPEFGAIDALRASDGNYDSAKKALIDKQSRQQVDLSPEIAALESLQAKGAKPLDKNLYRGEYRWPDPAKESATPLTGEDLLQWDRPLSEQPESVRRAVSELGIVGGNMELPAGGLDMSGGGRILDNRDGKVKPGSVAPYVLVSGDNKFDISEKDLQRMLGGSDDPTGEQIYTRLTAKLGDQNAASKALGALGAPGIRYLDGMSRDGGKGTYNYVMFDDKGIKLLERNGSPIEDFAARRAGKAKPYREAMGADTMPAMPKQEPTKPDYGITHRPPMRDSGAPLFDATGGGNVYPDDVYSAKAQQYYGTGDAKLDRETFRLLQSYRNEPDAPVTIYRAVPADVDATDINAGDWVTVNKAYADMHGQGFDGGYKIIKKQVKAKDIYTNGDSIHEWGYDPDGL